MGWGGVSAGATSPSAGAGDRSIAEEPSSSVGLGEAAGSSSGEAAGPFTGDPAGEVDAFGEEAMEGPDGPGEEAVADGVGAADVAGFGAALGVVAFVAEGAGAAPGETADLDGAAAGDDDGGTAAEAATIVKARARAITCGVILFELFVFSINFSLFLFLQRLVFF